MTLKHDEGWNIPWNAPFYPKLPAIYRQVKFHYVVFETRPEAVSGFLPEPLKPSPDGECVASGLDVPICTNYGPFLESFLLLKADFRGQAGYYCSHVFHTGPAGIAAGREIYGTPKIFSQIQVRQMERSMLTETFMGGIPVMTLSSVPDQIIPAQDLPRWQPNWRLKIIPRADRPGPALKQLVDTSKAARDQEIHFCAQGHGTVRFEASPLVDLTPLEPLTYKSAYHLECSFSEHFGEIFYDYLADSG